MDPRGLDPIIHQPARLQILAALHRNREVRFTDLRDALNLTPGNLASHAQKLERAGYIRSRRRLLPVGFEFRYAITDAGSRAFRDYLAKLRDLLAILEATADAPQPATTPRDAPPR